MSSIVLARNDMYKLTPAPSLFSHKIIGSVYFIYDRQLAHPQAAPCPAEQLPQLQATPWRPVAQPEQSQAGPCDETRQSAHPQATPCPTRQFAHPQASPWPVRQLGHAHPAAWSTLTETKEEDAARAVGEVEAICCLLTGVKAAASRELHAMQKREATAAVRSMVC